MGLSLLYDATSLAAEINCDDDGICLAAARVIKSLNDAVGDDAADDAATCALAAHLFGRAQVRLKKAAAIDDQGVKRVRARGRKAKFVAAAPAAARVGPTSGWTLAELRRVGIELERAGLDLAMSLASNPANLAALERAGFCEALVASFARPMPPLPTSAGVGEGSRVHIDKMAALSLSGTMSSPKADWAYGVVEAVIGSNLFKTYRVRYDDGETWEGVLREPFYELVEKDALGCAQQRVDREHFSDAIALASKLVKRPLACAELRLARPHVAGFGTILLRATVHGASTRERVHEECMALLSKTKPREPDAAAFCFRGATSATAASSSTPTWTNSSRFLAKSPSSAQETLARLLRVGVLQAGAPAEEKLAEGALDAVRAASPGATWQTLSLNAHLAEMAALNTLAAMPPWSSLGDFTGAAWPEDKPRKLAEFAAAAVVAFAVHAEHTARQKCFASDSELVAQRRELASLNVQAGRNSSWRLLDQAQIPALKTALLSARMKADHVIKLRAQLEATRGLRMWSRLPIDDALDVVGEFAISRLKAEVAISEALEAAHTSHISCLRAVSGRRYALGAIHDVLGAPLPRVDWRSCIGNDDTLAAPFGSSGGFDDAWRAAAATLKQRLAIALFVEEERGALRDKWRLGDRGDTWQPAARARERHLDQFLESPVSIGADPRVLADALSYDAAAAAREAAIEMLSADLRGVPRLRAARRACGKLARRRRGRENALEGRITSIARRWIFQPGDEAIWSAVSPDGRDRRCVIVSRSGVLPTTGVVIWRVASDGISDHSIVATLLKKDLALLNAGATIEARKQALATAETTLAVRTRAEQRRVLGEARTALGPAPPGAVDWRACVFEDEESFLFSDDDVLRGLEFDDKIIESVAAQTKLSPEMVVEIEKGTIAEIARQAKCSCGEAVHANKVVSEAVEALSTNEAVLARFGEHCVLKYEVPVAYFEASAAALAAAAAAAGRELAARRARFQDVLDAAEVAPRGERPTMPAVLSRQALADLREAAAYHERGRAEDVATVELYAARIRDVFAAAGAAPSTSRLGHAVDDVEDAVRPATLERYLDRRAIDSVVTCEAEGDGLPFYPSVDLSRCFASENYLLGKTGRRCRYWEQRWRDVKTCSVCWDATPRAETVSGCLGGKASVCAHFDEVAASAHASFARHSSTMSRVSLAPGFRVSKRRVPWLSRWQH